MASELDNVHHAIQATIILTFALLLKFIYSCSVLGVAKGRAGTRAKEDPVSILRGAGSTDLTSPLVEGYAGAADRAQRIVNNVRK